MLAEVIGTIQAVNVDSLTRPRLEAVLVELMAVEATAKERRLAAMAALDSLKDGGSSSETVARSKGMSSAQQATRDRKTAEQLESMPKTRAKLANGEITAEHADAVADAAEQTGDPEAADDALSRESDVPADLFARRSRKWINDREKQADTDARARRQHRNRKAVFGRSKDDGSWTMFVTGATDEGRELKGLIDAECDRLFREDGGRENPTRPRTDDQRRFDALANLIRRGAGKLAPTNSRPHPKYTGVVTIPVSAYLDPEHGGAELIGDGPLPTSVLQRILCDSELQALVVDDDGNPLWAGRSTRTATDAQWRALIARDQGCVICGADPTRCEAHHLIWWRNLGPTDITNLALVCTRHHHDIHDRNLDLTRRSGTWRLQPRTRAGPHRNAA